MLSCLICDGAGRLVLLMADTGSVTRIGAEGSTGDGDEGVSGGYEPFDLDIARGPLGTVSICGSNRSLKVLLRGLESGSSGREEPERKTCEG